MGETKSGRGSGQVSPPRAASEKGVDDEDPKRSECRKWPHHQPRRLSCEPGVANSTPGLLSFF